MIKNNSPKTIICLMGPTASGKTSLALEIARDFNCEIISVDSAMVYKGMNIGTAKPSPDILHTFPHRLIDRVDPSERYSAGQFRVDALREINDIIALGKIPLLVGGTMLYFRVLQQGLAKLPSADANVREEIHARANQLGWEALHAELANIDPIAANRIQLRDRQRISRALEVYQLTGKTITAWQVEDTHPLSGFYLYNLALIPTNRTLLHERIAKRFMQMLELGLVDEVKHLHARGDLCTELTSMRSVGYRQVWEYLSGELTYEEMIEKAIAATRQLAKRQLTWLRSWPNLISFDSDAADLYAQISTYLST